MDKGRIGRARKTVCAMIGVAMCISLLGLSNAIMVGPSGKGQTLVNTLSLTVRDWIFIDGDNDFTLAHGVTDGSGSPSDPYMIEGWNIDAATAEGFYAAGISIINTNSYFIVRDCYIHGGLAVLLWHCANGILSNITCASDSGGMLLDHATSIVIADSTFEPYSGGISLWVSDSNTFSDNHGFDVWLGSSQGETFRNNAMVRGGIQIDGELARFWRHDIDASNTLNGKPIYYYNGQMGGVVPAGAGQVILAECSGMTVQNQNTSSIRLGYSSNNTLSGNNCPDYSNSTSWSSAGIILESSHNNLLVNNTCSNTSWKGIALHSSNGNSLIHNICSNDFNGIDFYFSNSNKLVGNVCTLNNHTREHLVTTHGCGIIITSSNNNVFDNNNCSSCGHGISLYLSDNNILIGNNCSSSDIAGISLSACFNATLINNTLNGNGMTIGGDEVSQWNTHTIDPSNTIDGRPVYYLKDWTGITVPSGVGQVILANCTDVVVKNMDLSRVACGIAIGFSSNTLVVNNNCSSMSMNGICLVSSNDNSLTNNTFTSNGQSGISLESSNGNALVDNDCRSNNWYGISLSSSSENTLVNNDCRATNWTGISLSSSSNNNVSNNNCSDCDTGIGLDSSSNNVVADNYCSSNWRGLFVFFSYNNLLARNNCSWNDCGVILDSSSSSNVIVQNWFIHNYLYGVSINMGSDNLIWNNTFTSNNGAGSTYDSNHSQAYDDGTNNSWNSTVGCGNRWSDWTTPDILPPSGIVDVPYSINGSAAAKDYFPLTVIPTQDMLLSLVSELKDALAAADALLALQGNEIESLRNQLNGMRDEINSTQSEFAKSNQKIGNLESMQTVLLSVVVLLLALSAIVWGRGYSRSRDDVQPQYSGGSSTQALSVRNSVNGSNVEANGLSQDKHWPARAISGPLRVTAKERILLHLLHFARYADSPEVPPELTQERIAEAAGIERRHFTQYVHPLEEDELVRERTSRVRGVVQKRRVYVLTEEGVRRTLGVRDRVRSAMVRVRDGSGVRDVTVAEALLEARGSMSVLDILRESIETGVVDLTRSDSSGREPTPVTVLDSSNGEEINLVR